MYTRALKQHSRTDTRTQKHTRMHAHTHARTHKGMRKLDTVCCLFVVGFCFCSGFFYFFFFYGRSIVKRGCV